MSGIFGIIHRDGRPVDAADLERMREAMAHRGPDGSEIWIDGSAGLGQLMLHSTPESLHETLPWKDPESGLVITADARLDNRSELIASLGVDLNLWEPALRAIEEYQNSENRRQGRLPQDGIPDSQLILAAYKRWGEACVDHLLGDFAFAIWNPREKRLFCARDHMGIRPFYYYLAKELFVFASSALGVVSAEVVPRRISEQRIADHLFWELEGADKTCTFFEDVWRMPPSHAGTFSSQGFSSREYWRLDTEFELKLGSDEAYVDAFEEVFSQAISARMRCHKPVCSMLSGGLDSSTIVGIARSLQMQDSAISFATFSGVSEEGEDCRESLYSSKVIDQGNLEATLLRPSDLPAYEERMNQVDKWLEDPFEAGWILHKMIYLASRDQGHVVVMDGIDGDGVASLTTSYPTYLIRNWCWWAANQEIWGMWKNYHRGHVALWKKYFDALRPLAPEFARKLKRKWVGANDNWIDDYYLISHEYAKRTGLQARLEASRKLNAVSDCETLRQAHAKRMSVPYLTAAIERYGRLASCCGVEQRQPLLDKRVVEHCISLPWRQLVRRGWAKYGMRCLAERFIPSDVAWRPGWDEVMWKFWNAGIQMNRKSSVVTLSVIPDKVSPLLNKKKFTDESNRFRMGDETACESIVNLVFLANWVNRNL